MLSGRVINPVVNANKFKVIMACTRESGRGLSPDRYNLQVIRPVRRCGFGGIGFYGEIFVRVVGRCGIGKLALFGEQERKFGIENDYFFNYEGINRVNR
jgi:hypothetical protein